MPAIIVELDLETRAGNSAFNPGGASQEDNSLEFLHRNEVSLGVGPAGRGHAGGAAYPHPGTAAAYFWSHSPAGANPERNNRRVFRSFQDFPADCGLCRAVITDKVKFYPASTLAG